MAIRLRPDRRSAKPRWRASLASMGLGAALSYFFDPARGRGRRVRLRDQALKLTRRRARQLKGIEHDLANRAHGMLAGLKATLEAEKPDDEVVHERVRSALGRVCSHAGAVEVSVSEGTVRLSGPIAVPEHARVLRRIARVPGVQAVRDDLSPHAPASEAPGRQEGGRRPPRSSAAVARCADLMKRKVEAVREEDNVDRAAQLMALANVGFLPVCDSQRKVVGTITDRDIVVRLVAQGSPWPAARVASLMSRDLVTCRPDDEVTLAEQLMAQRQVSRVVITDGEGRLEGVISLSDIAEREPARRAARTLRAVAAREAQVV